MKVKVGSVMHDPDNVPIMVILDEMDKARIASMGPAYNKYISAPEGWFKTMEDLEKWHKDI